MYEDIRLTEVAQGIDKLVRTVLQLARDRQPAPRPESATGAASPGRRDRPGRRRARNPMQARAAAGYSSPRFRLICSRAFWYSTS